LGLILNIETATEVCSVSLGKDGQEILTLESNQPQTHASQLTCLIEQLIVDCGYRIQDLDAIAVSSGPGSYTGLRIGAAVAKGICYATDCGLIAIDTLESLAHATKEIKPEGDYFIPMIDARRMEVYTSVYDNDLNCLEEKNAKIIDENSFLSYRNSNKKSFLSGNGAKKTLPFFNENNIQFIPIFCSAKHLNKLSEKNLNIKNFVNLAYYSPEYIKSPKITISKKRL